MRLLGLPVALPDRHIPHVVGGRSDVQVLPSDARRIVASMQNQQTVRHRRSVVDLPRDDMRPAFAPGTVRHAADPHPPVSVLVCALGPHHTLTVHSRRLNQPSDDGCRHGSYLQLLSNGLFRRPIVSLGYAAHHSTAEGNDSFSSASSTSRSNARQSTPTEGSLMP